MQNPVFDDIVVGLGGAGSSSVYHLAKRGRRVLGIEQFNLGHDLGSSHGLSRIIRLAYHEGPEYVSLLKRSYELWDDLERSSNQKLFTKTGCLNIGPPNSQVFEGCLSSAIRYGISHEVLDAEQVMSRFPAFKLPRDMKAVFQPNAGYLDPERCILAYLGGAIGFGAEIRAREKVKSWEKNGNGVTVVTDRGTYSSKRIVFTAGAWTSRLVGEIGIPLIPERQVVGWFKPTKPELFTPERLPVWILNNSENGKDNSFAYGFPIHGIPGFKLGIYHHRREQVTNPDDYDRMPNDADEELLRDFLKKYFPLADGPTLALMTCLFTNTPDEHFLLDFHPNASQAIVVSCCSGHGFKFCSVIGEIVADLSIEGKTSLDIQPFSLLKRKNNQYS